MVLFNKSIAANSLLLALCKACAPMRCPHCAVEVYESWELLFNKTPDFRGDPSAYLEDEVGSHNIQGFDTPIKAQISFLWMHCPNKVCRRLIVKGLFTRRTYSGGIPQDTKLDEWIILPRRTTRYIDPLIPAQYADDYRQAAAILGASPKASAGLSRRILADLLQDYGGHKEFKLSSRIDAFISDKRNPWPLRNNLHYLREIADFGVHTQKDDASGSIIDVEPEEAEWCLDILDRLFDYYIIGPKRDQELHTAFDAKLTQVQRKVIKPLPKDGQ